MSPRVNRGKPSLRCLGNKVSLAVLTSCILTVPVDSVSAHKVKVGTDVGATLHIEPNDNPRSGEAAKTWFALTRKGGKVIPLKECNCQLAVYAEPHTAGEPALIQPSLKPVAAERYQGTPGTEITFPKPGIYQLQLTGKPLAGGNFKPFKFNFEVTVAGGTSVIEPQNAQNVNQNVNDEQPQNTTQQFSFWAIALPIFAVVAIFFGILLAKRGVRK